MRLLFLHHQQRRPYTDEPGYNELFRPLIRARQVTGWHEFVYQTPLREHLLRRLVERGTPLSGDPSRFIAAHFDAALYEEGNIALLPALLSAVEQGRPDIIIYSMTWMTETIHPGSFHEIRQRFPSVKIAAVLWDHGEGGTFFHSYEQQLLNVVDFYASADSQSRVRKIRARQPPYENYEHVERVHWFPTPLDPEIFRPPQPGEAKDMDVAVLGSSEGYRREIIAALRDRFGPRFVHVGGHMPEDRFVSLEDYAAAIRRARIVVNTQTWPGARVQVKGRVREVLSCGSFLLEQDNPESREFLEGSNVVLFRDRTDLMPQIDRFLAHPDEREAVARAAHGWYRARHSPDLAMQAIIDGCGVGRGG